MWFFRNSTFYSLNISFGQTGYLPVRSVANTDLSGKELLLDNKAGIRYFDLSRLMIGKMDNDLILSKNRTT